jgi:DNA invertase Pin-like site-specific DNA recombinase
MIRARIGEGRERAKAQGMRMGRKPKLTDHQKCEAIKRCDHGDEMLAEIGRGYNVSGWTISRLMIRLRS